VSEPSSNVSELEWVRAFADCMRSEGFAVVVDEEVPTFLPADEGGLTEEQISGWDEAVRICQGKVGRPPAPEPLSRDDLSALYDETVAAKRCLERLGFSISGPPGREAWIDSNDDPDGPWLPHAQLPHMSEEEWRRVSRECPQPG